MRKFSLNDKKKLEKKLRKTKNLKNCCLEKIFNLCTGFKQKQLENKIQ